MAAMRVRIGVAKRPQAPNAVADIHEESVEEPEARAVERRQRRELTHDSAQTAFVCCHHPAEAGYHGERGGEVEDVDEDGVRDGKTQGLEDVGVGDDGGGRFIEVEDGKMGGSCVGGRGLGDCEGEGVGMLD